MTEPGWYDDERDPTVARWHDGIAWTRHAMRKADWTGDGAPPPPVEAPPAPVPAPGPAPAPKASAPPAAAKVSKPPKAAKPPRAKRERPGWLRWKVVVPIVAGAALLFALQQIFLTDDPTDPIRSSGLPTYGAEWTTADGSAYRITVVPSNELVHTASPDGCIKAPASGHTSVGFSVRVENLSDHPAPFPDVAFAANVNADGAVDLSALTLTAGSRNIEVTPRVKGTPCDEAYLVRPAGRGKLKEGGSATFEAVVGGIVEPPPTGLALIVRYVQADGAKPGGSTTAEILAPFPRLAAPKP